jgi:alkylglycerol monooxygenase
MSPIVYAIPVFLATILIEAWVAHRRGTAVYNVGDAVTSLHMGVLSQVTNSFAKLATLGIYVAVYENLRVATWPTEPLWAWAAALLVYDFLYYWFHRLSHEVAVLWAAHVVHHTSEYFNLSTALRQTSTGAALGWLFYLPMAVAGVPPMMFVVVALINLLYQYWPHTQLIGKLGWVDRVFVTPSNHRVHHGQNDYCIDRNYGGILILWDRLFGSFAEERDDEPVCFGVRKPLASFNPLWGNVHYYVDLWRESRRARGWRDRLLPWLAPPGGWPARPRQHFDAREFRRFDPGTPRPLSAYAIVHYTLTTAALVHFLVVVAQLAPTQAWAYALVIAVSALSIGGLLESARWAKWIEQSRLVVLGAAVVALPLWFGSAMPAALRAAIALLAAASLVWISRQALRPAAGGKEAAL